MKIYEVIQRQQTDSDSIFLLPQGAFFHVYADGACMLHSLLGYKLRKGSVRKLPNEYVFCGFPISSLDNVIVRIMKVCTGYSLSMEKEDTLTIIRLQKL